MKKPATSGALGLFGGLLLLCSCATRNLTQSQHLIDVPINKDAGRGQFLLVMVRLGDGDELPFVVDTGSSITFLDKSLAPRLGKPLGHTTFSRWWQKEEATAYAAPSLYLGNTLLTTGDWVWDFDCKPFSSDGSRPVMGILGMDVMKHYCIQLDFAAGRCRFLNVQNADKQTWGKGFPIEGSRPTVAENLMGAQGPHSLIDSGWVGSDGWLMPKYFQQWTNRAVMSTKADARRPHGMFGGDKYLLVDLSEVGSEVDGIGLGFLARHLVTFDFPGQTMYLKRQSIGPPPNPMIKTTPMEALNPLIKSVLLEDAEAAQKDVMAIQKSRATQLEKTVARKLAATLEAKPKPGPADLPPEVTELSLGELGPSQAEVGWLQPTANRIPLNAEIPSPFLDSGKIYATGLYAHAPSRYVYNLGGSWKALHGEAGLHTAFQHRAFGVVFVIKTDGKEVFRSSIIHGPDHARYDLNVTDVKTLELLVENASANNGGNWGLWLDPTLSRK